jgi:hypothetical protein
MRFAIWLLFGVLGSASTASAAASKAKPVERPLEVDKRAGSDPAQEAQRRKAAEAARTALRRTESKETSIDAVAKAMRQVRQPSREPAQFRDERTRPLHRGLVIAPVELQRKKEKKEKEEPTPKQLQLDPAVHLTLDALLSELKDLDRPALERLTSREKYQVADSFDGAIWYGVLRREIQFLRIQRTDGDPEARWYLCCETPGADGARQVDVTGRALPPWNTQELLTTVEFPAGTAVIVGRAADVTYQPTGGADVTARGGAFQFYLPALPAQRKEHRYRRLPPGSVPTAAALRERSNAYIRATLQAAPEPAATGPSPAVLPGQSVSIPTPADAIPKPLPTDALPTPSPVDALPKWSPVDARPAVPGASPAWFEQISKLWRRWSQSAQSC